MNESCILLGAFHGSLKQAVGVDTQLREAEEEADRREKILQQELAPLTEEMRSLRRQRAELVEEQHSLQANIASLQSQHDGLTQVALFPCISQVHLACSFGLSSTASSEIGLQGRLGLFFLSPACWSAISEGNHRLLQLCGII